MSNSRVYIGGIPRETDERDLERFFKGYGRLTEVFIRRGFAFVQFDDSRDAEDAIYDMDGKTILGKRVNVEKARGEPKGRDRWPSTRKIDRSRGKYGAPIRTKYKLIVKNLSYKASWQDLKDFMRKAGEVTYGDAHRPCKNEGVVEFASYSDMRAAIRKLDGVSFKGEKIHLIEDKESGRDRYVRSRSRSRSHKRSRSRSHSRSHSLSRSRSHSRGRSQSRSRSRSHSRRSSRTRSPSKSRSHSPRRVRSPKRSASDSPKKSESRTPPKREVSCQRSKNGVQREITAGSSRSGRSQSRAESNSPHRRSHSSRSGPRTPSPVGSERESGVGPRRKCRSRSRSKSRRGGASPDRRRTRSRSRSRSNSLNSGTPSPNTSRKRSRSTSPSEMPAKRFSPRAN